MNLNSDGSEMPRLGPVGLSPGGISPLPRRKHPTMKEQVMKRVDFGDFGAPKIRKFYRMRSSRTLIHHDIS